MRNPKLILGIAILVLLIAVGWQIGSRELANINLQEDLRDMASQAGTHIGYVPPSSDGDLIGTIVRKAKERDIDLKPDQVTLQHRGSGETSTLYLAADYTIPVNLVFFSFTLHFTPSSQKKSG